MLSIIVYLTDYLRNVPFALDENMGPAVGVFFKGHIEITVVGIVSQAGVLSVIGRIDVELIAVDDPGRGGRVVVGHIDKEPVELVALFPGHVKGAVGHDQVRIGRVVMVGGTEGRYRPAAHRGPGAAAEGFDIDMLGVVAFVSPGVGDVQLAVIPGHGRLGQVVVVPVVGHRAAQGGVGGAAGV